MTNSSSNPRMNLKRREEDLTSSLICYAKNPGDKSLENGLKRRLVDFLEVAHNASYVKSRYMRHVGRLLAEAMMQRQPLPWNEVQGMENLVLNPTNTPDHIILQGEVRGYLVQSCSTSRPVVDVSNHDMQSSGPEDGPSGSEYVLSEMTTSEMDCPPPKKKGGMKGCRKSGRDLSNPNSKPQQRCRNCTDVGHECTYRLEHWACDSCHLQKKQCDQAALRRAQKQALKTTVALQGKKGPQDLNSNTAELKELVIRLAEMEKKHQDFSDNFSLLQKQVGELEETQRKDISFLRERVEALERHKGEDLRNFLSLHKIIDSLRTDVRELKTNLAKQGHSPLAPENPNDASLPVHPRKKQKTF